jgi:precorrin-2 dehydrogenase/sirohydrochlorin ferrochelatase
MPLYEALPISLYVRGRKCVVVGEGEQADARATRLREHGAQVEHIASADYQSSRLAGAFLVMVQAGDRESDPAAAPVRVAEDARAAGALTYVADRPDLSDLAMPGLVRRGPLKIAISSDAAVPALTRHLRREIERLVASAGTGLDALIETLQRRRDEIPRETRSAVLGAIAARLRIRGHIEIADEEAPVPPERGGLRR